MTLPGAARQFVKLLPIAFVPSSHSILYYVLLTALDAQPAKKVRLIPAHGPVEASVISELFIYSTTDRTRHFPCLLFQTRYGANCFAKQLGEGGAGSVFFTGSLGGFTQATAPRVASRGDTTHIQPRQPLGIRATRLAFEPRFESVPMGWTTPRGEGERQSAFTLAQS